LRGAASDATLGNSDRVLQPFGVAMRSEFPKGAAIVAPSDRSRRDANATVANPVRTFMTKMFEPKAETAVGGLRSSDR